MWRHYVYADQVCRRQDRGARSRDWGGLRRPALSILCKILKSEFLNGWRCSAVPVRVRCHCYANERTTDGNVSSRAEWFRCRNRWKYRIRCRLISYEFRCRKFPAARCRLSPFPSPPVTVSRPCCLSEFTPYRALWMYVHQNSSVFSADLPPVKFCNIMIFTLINPTSRLSAMSHSNCPLNFSK